MLKFLDIEPDNEVLLAGYKPLPKGRMLKQAGRELNDFYTKGQAGKFSRETIPFRGIDKIVPKATFNRLMQKDPEMADMYKRQVLQGKPPNAGDRFNLNEFNDRITIKKRPIRLNKAENAASSREDNYIRDKGYKGNSPTPEDVKKRTLNRLEEVQRFINEDYDPIGAVEKEAQNRKRGGNKPLVNGPDVDPAAAVELIQPIAPLDGEIRPAGMIPGV